MQKNSGETVLPVCVLRRLKNFEKRKMSVQKPRSAAKAVNVRVDRAARKRKDELGRMKAELLSLVHPLSSTFILAIRPVASNDLFAPIELLRVPVDRTQLPGNIGTRAPPL